MQRKHLQHLDFTETYRPAKWEDVIGQDAVLASLRPLLSAGRKRCFMFGGPAGVGKSSIAGLILTELRCQSFNRRQINAAEYSKIKQIRELLPGYNPIRGAAKMKKRSCG